MNKSLFRRPGTKHFTLVHRSQRDPLINDPDASDRVFKEVEVPQKKPRGSHPTAADDEEVTRDEELGDAAAYGIYFDDKEYDYMQHLRAVGTEHDSYLVEAPTTSKKGKARAKDADFEIKEPIRLPDDVLPSHPLDEISYTDITTGHAPVVGLQPDLDPAIREVLEALDDEAYAVDDGTGSDDEHEFWSNVVGGGELGEGEQAEWVDEKDDEVPTVGTGKGWDDVAKYKARQAAISKSDNDTDDDDIGSDEEIDSEGGDTIADLRASSARRPPRKVAASSRAGSQFSMTSSAMFRNEGLRTLDDRFDEVERMYADDSDDSWGGGHSSDDDGEDADSARRAAMPPLRTDLDQIMDDFLSRFEVLGGKMRPVLEGTPGVEGTAGKLDRIRRELAILDIGDEVEGEAPNVTARRKEKERILQIVERQEREAESRKDRIKMPVEREKERWDCETVLSTYSNVSNHPRMLRLREANGPRPSRIQIDERTGFPLVDGVEAVPKKRRPRGGDDEDVEIDSDDEGEERPETIIRPRNETAEEKKARKAAVKQERSVRRTEKKQTKEAFGNETKRQKRIAGKAVAGGAAADVRVGEGVRRLA